MSQDSAGVAACYDAVASRYAERFTDELRGKPFDRALLEGLAEEVRGEGRVCDLGCGPGHVSAFLAGLGVDVLGVDLSEGQVQEARRRFPDIEFRSGNMLLLDLESQRLAAIVAMYSIVHFTLDQLEVATREMYRVLAPAGRLLVSFHVGSGRVHLEEFLEHPVSIDFTWFEVADVVGRIEEAGFERITVQEREPYPEVEAQTRRAYVQARKPG